MIWLVYFSVSFNLFSFLFKSPYRKVKREMSHNYRSEEAKRKAEQVNECRQDIKDQPD